MNIFSKRISMRELSHGKIDCDTVVMSPDEFIKSFTPKHGIYDHVYKAFLEHYSKGYYNGLLARYYTGAGYSYLFHIDLLYRIYLLMNLNIQPHIKSYDVICISRNPDFIAEPFWRMVNDCPIMSKQNWVKKENVAILNEKIRISFENNPKTAFYSKNETLVILDDVYGSVRSVETIIDVKKRLEYKKNPWNEIIVSCAPNNGDELDTFFDEAPNNMDKVWFGPIWKLRPRDFPEPEITHFINFGNDSGVVLSVPNNMKLNTKLCGLRLKTFFNDYVGVPLYKSPLEMVHLLLNLGMNASLWDAKGLPNHTTGEVPTIKVPEQTDFEKNYSLFSTINKTLQDNGKDMDWLMSVYNTFKGETNGNGD